MGDKQPSLISPFFIFKSKINQNLSFDVQIYIFFLLKKTKEGDRGRLFVPHLSFSLTVYMLFMLSRHLNF
jgi:hypothetical protein